VQFASYQHDQIRAPVGLVSRFRRFAGVGFCGLAADAIVFFVVTAGIGWPVASGRGLASLIAITVTWLLNRSITFVDRQSAPPIFELGKYMVATLPAALSNLWLTTVLSPLDKAYAHAPSYVLGAIVGLAINFVLYDRVVFARRSEEPDRRTAASKGAGE
jgi:putative flippase GtrA